MRISDWSSDVCSSDLEQGAQLQTVVQEGTHRRHHHDGHRTMAAQGENALDFTPQQARSRLFATRSRMRAHRLSQARWQDHLRPAQFSLYFHHQSRRERTYTRSDKHTSELQSLI